MGRLRRFDTDAYPQRQWQLGLPMEIQATDGDVRQHTVNLRHPEQIRKLEEGDPVYTSKRRRQGAVMLEFINNYADKLGLPILTN